MNVKPIFYISFCIFCLELGFSQDLYGQKFVNEFLNIGVGAKAQGMFGAMVAQVNDGTAGYWNPAGLVDIQVPMQLNAMHANWFGGIANYDYASISRRISDKNSGVGSFTFIRMGVDNIPNTLNLIAPDGSIDYDRVTNFSAADYAGIISYGQCINQQKTLSVGGSVKVIHRSFGNFGKGWGFGADIGMIYRVNNFRFGATVRDITTTFNAYTFNLTDDQKAVFQATNNELPASSTEITLPRFIIGGSYLHTIANLSFLGELDLNISTDGTEGSLLGANRFDISPIFGAEIGYYNKVFLRFGVGNLQSIVNPQNVIERSFDIQPNMGVGVRLGKIRVDYALANIGGVSGILSSHIFSLAMDFEPRAKS